MIDNTTEKIYISHLHWERIFLHMEITSEIGEDLSFALRRFARITPAEKKDVTEELVEIHTYEEIPIDPESVTNDDSGSAVYRFVLNVTCLNGRTFLDNGFWQIQAHTVSSDGTKDSLTCSVSRDVAYMLDDLSRIFPYGEGKYTYIAGFSTYSDNREMLTFVLNSRFTIEYDGWKKRHYFREATTGPDRVKRFYMSIVVNLMRAYYQVVERLSPKNGKRIMFMTETKPYLWGNLKYIDDRMKARGLDKKYDITYSLRNAVGQHKSTMSWVRLITNIAKQDYIFVDDYVPVFGFLDLNKRTRLIQVWHAGVGFKSVGYSRFGKFRSPFPSGSCHKKYDYAVTGSEELVHVYEEVFGLPEEVFLPVGMARLDGYLDPERIASFKESFYAEHPELKGRKIILFAPTYRGSLQKTAYYDYGNLDMDRIYEFCGDEYAWVFKMHPFVKEKPPIPEAYGDRIFDLSDFENINDLYYVTEIHITDYSSSYFEFALMEKPILFYTYDREIYELTRGVHKDIRTSAPGKVCDTFDELMQALSDGDYDYEKTRDFYERNFGNYDGNASDRIIDAILAPEDK